MRKPNTGPVSDSERVGVGYRHVSAISTSTAIHVAIVHDVHDGSTSTSTTLTAPDLPTPYVVVMSVFSSENFIGAVKDDWRLFRYSLLSGARVSPHFSFRSATVAMTMLSVLPSVAARLLSYTRPRTTLLPRKPLAHILARSRSLISIPSPHIHSLSFSARPSSCLSRNTQTSSAYVEAGLMATSSVSPYVS